MMGTDRGWDVYVMKAEEGDTWRKQWDLQDGEDPVEARSNYNYVQM